MSRQDLAGRAGVDASTIFRVERGLTTPGTETLKRLATALDLPAAQLLEDEGHESTAGLGRGIRIGLVPTAQSAAVVLPPGMYPESNAKFSGWRTRSFVPMFDDEAEQHGADAVAYDSAALLQDLMSARFDCIVLPRSIEDWRDLGCLSRAGMIFLSPGGMPRARVGRGPVVPDVAVLDVLMIRDHADGPTYDAVWAFLRAVNKNLLAISEAGMVNEARGLGQYFRGSVAGWKHQADELFRTVRQAELVMGSMWFSLLKRKVE